MIIEVEPGNPTARTGAGGVPHYWQLHQLGANGEDGGLGMAGVTVTLVRNNEKEYS